MNWQNVPDEYLPELQIEHKENSLPKLTIASNRATLKVPNGYDSFFLDILETFSKEIVRKLYFNGMATVRGRFHFYTDPFSKFTITMSTDSKRFNFNFQKFVIYTPETELTIMKIGE